MPRLNRTLVLAVTAVAVIAGCARMGPPPGGPRDNTPPLLIATVPESVVVLEDYDGWVTFEFDEVIDEGGTPSFGRGNSTLEQLIQISPDTTRPQVRWRRNRIQVRPRDGWLPNAVYRVELAAGLRDLSRNASNTAAVVTFTTGAPIPTHALSGSAVDWASGNFLPRALVEAMLLPDSLTYRTRADSSGRFSLSPLPEGEYLITVARDENSNGRRDGREPWDTARVAISSQSAGEVWVFVRDTVGPRLAQNGVAVHDSFSVALSFNVPLDTLMSIPAESIRIMVLPDSAPISVRGGLSPARHDSIYKPLDAARQAEAARAADTTRTDSTRADTAVTPRPAAGADAAARPGAAAAADTTRKPQQQRAPINSRVVIRSQAIFQPGISYMIKVYGVKALNGVVADSTTALLVMPPRPPVDTTRKTTPDSTATAAPPDTTTSEPLFRRR